MKDTPETIDWNGMILVRISDVGPEFEKWLYGQTVPLVEENAEPYDWAYYWDYSRFLNKRRIID